MYTKSRSKSDRRVSLGPEWDITDDENEPENEPENWNEYDPVVIDASLEQVSLSKQTIASKRIVRSSGSDISDEGDDGSVESGSDDEASEDEDVAGEGPKEKVKALKRVMPALLARKLADKAERDYQAKKKREAREAKEAARELEQRPGQAIRRKGNKNAVSSRKGIEDMFDDTGVENLEDERPHFALDQPPDPMIAIFSSDDEPRHTLTGTSSEEEEDESDEDEQVMERDRQIRFGDFESLLHGPKPGAGSKSKTKVRSTTLLRRPRLNNARRSTAAKSKTKSKNQLRQEKLDFPAVSSSRDKRHTPKKTPRPRKRLLDDATIFDLDVTQAQLNRQKRITPKAPRHKSVDSPRYNGRHHSSQSLTFGDARSPRTPGPADKQPTSIVVPHETSDMWDELQEFQIDFAIKPLQLGVHFESTSYLGSGSLKAVLAYTEGLSFAAPRQDDLEVLGLTLGQSMAMSSFITILPVAIDKVLDDVLGVMNDRKQPSESQAVAALRFMTHYLATAVYDDSTIRECQTALQTLQDGFKTIIVPRSTKNRDQVAVLFRSQLQLMLLWMVLEKSDCDQEYQTAFEYQTGILATMSAIIEHLLRYGFDRTMKPLKAIMSCEADSGTISDYTAECWVSLMQIGAAWDRTHPLVADSQSHEPSQGAFDRGLEEAFNRAFEGRQTGPRASERIWYLTLGLAALSQFDIAGVIPAHLKSDARWPMVRKAMGAVKINSMPEAEETTHRYQLKPRDKYLKIMVIRCLQLTSIWRWPCDRESFAIATKDLGFIFKARALRNLPNESYGDFPLFIRQFDRTLTEDIDMEESAYNLYLQLVCLCASDMVTMPSNITEAKTAATDVQRLMLQISPFSPVRFVEGRVPSARQLSALINRYSTSVIAALFDAKLLNTFLLPNSKKWIDFSKADTESRRTVLRGLMYLGVAARHHGESLEPVVALLSSHFETIQQEKTQLQAQTVAQIREREKFVKLGMIPPALDKEQPNHQASILERDRLLVLIVGCFRTLITTHSYDSDVQAKPPYPNPELLADCWTHRLRSTELVSDRKAGLEVVACVQSFLDQRAAAMPRRVPRRVPQQPLQPVDVDSQGTDWSSMGGLEFTEEDLLAIDRVHVNVSPETIADGKAAQVSLLLVCSEKPARNFIRFDRILLHHD